jgi:hypothetical protein
VTTEEDGKRVVRSETSAGTLVARWTLLGHGGDWWQTEYPVKTKEDLAAALELVQSKSYVLDTSDSEGSRSNWYETLRLRLSVTWTIGLFPLRCTSSP